MKCNSVIKIYDTPQTNDMFFPRLVQFDPNCSCQIYNDRAFDDDDANDAAVR